MKELDVKNVFLIVLGMTLTALFGWTARGWYELANSTSMDTPRARVASPVVAGRVNIDESTIAELLSDVPPPTASTELAVPAEVLAPIATVTTTIAPPAVALEPVALIRNPAAPRSMIVPVSGVPRSAIRDMFGDARGDHRHEAIDIMAPRGTPVIAADDGVVKKLFTSKAGGITVYQFDPDEQFCYYYAHLDRYAARLHEGQTLRRGEVLGYVGSTGNAAKDAPHLHFALIRLDVDKRWWKGTYVNPYPLLTVQPAR